MLYDVIAFCPECKASKPYMLYVKRIFWTEWGTISMIEAQIWCLECEYECTKRFDINEFIKALTQQEVADFFLRATSRHNGHS